MATLAALMAALALPPTWPAAARAQGDSTLARPFVPGGYDDKPHMRGMFGTISVGGYLEAHGTWEREDGVTTELGMQLTRWNLLASTAIGDHVRIFSEVEFEEAGQEVVVELAQLDLLLHSTFNVRGGILLLPLGRFNLAHDGPRNELPQRPAVATELLGVALAQPGLGSFGQFGGSGTGRLTYELYAVNGYHDGVIHGSPEGTRLPAGRFNPEDANLSPAWVGRTEWSSSRRFALGLSGYHGAWNNYVVDGLPADERRDVSVGVVDAHVEALSFAVDGEAAAARVDVPEGVTGVFASRQAGAYLQLSRPFGVGWIGGMPDSWLTAAVRGDFVDFDRDLPGDSFRSVTLGVNLRPVRWTAIKLAWMRGENRDRFDNRASLAQLQLGLASYF